MATVKADIETSTKQKTLLYLMGSFFSLLFLISCVWLYLVSKSSVFVASQSTQGTLFINGTASIGATDHDFICATLDWWPPDKCDYGTCSWGRASLLNLVSFLVVLSSHLAELICITNS